MILNKVNEENDQIYFGIQNKDVRLPFKEVVYGFEAEGRFKKSICLFELSGLFGQPFIPTLVFIQMKADDEGVDQLKSD